MSKKETELAVVDEKALAELRDSFPIDQGFNRVWLPRLGLVSQDKFEGKGKAAKLVKEAGQFFKEVQTDELDENKKKIWTHEDLGLAIEGVILYQRKQLRLFDETEEVYTSSPIYDNEEDVVPLFKEKVQVAKGTPAELKALYQYKDKDNKVKSKLEDNRILYVLLDEVVYQLNLRGSSMYSWLAYSRKVSPPTVITTFGSEAKEKGSIEWNMMTFNPKRNLNAEEVIDVLNRVKEIKEGIEAEKSFYNKDSKKEDEDFEKLAAKVQEDL